MGLIMTIFFVFLCIFNMNISITKSQDRDWDRERYRDQNFNWNGTNHRDQNSLGPGTIIWTRNDQDRDRNRFRFRSWSQNRDRSRDVLWCQPYLSSKKFVWQGANDVSLSKKCDWQGANDIPLSKKRVWRGANDVSLSKQRVWRGANNVTLSKKRVWRGANVAIIVRYPNKGKFFFASNVISKEKFWSKWEKHICCQTWTIKTKILSNLTTTIIKRVISFGQTFINELEHTGDKGVYTPPHQTREWTACYQANWEQTLRCW